jgi:hypothetical protein
MRAPLKNLKSATKEKKKVGKEENRRKIRGILNSQPKER